MSIEKYLKGELPEAEKHAFEAQMAQDAGLRERVARERDLYEQLETYFIRENIRAAMTEEREKPEKGKTRRVHWGWLVLMAILVLPVALFVPRWIPHTFNPAEEKKPPVLPQSPYIPPQNPTDEAEIAAAEETAPERTSPSTPIAGNRQKKPAMPNPSSSLRATTTKTDSALSVFVEQCIETDLLAATDQLSGRYRTIVEKARQKTWDSALILLNRLESDNVSNDTTLYLKGICYLGKERGTEAARCFVRLNQDGKYPGGAAEWGLALALLVEGESEAAHHLLEKITGQTGHPFSGKARLLKDKY